MKKFLNKLFTYSLTIVLLIMGVNAVYIYKINANNVGTVGSMKHDNAFIRDVPDSIQICNFGSSHGYYGFNYEDFVEKYTCFNFALPSQSLLYDFRIMQNYRGYIKNGAHVFIVISHFSFFGKPDTERIDFHSYNRRYYRFLRPQFIINYDKKIDFYLNYLPALVSDNMISFMKTILFSGKKDMWNDVTNYEDALKHSKIRYKVFIVDKLDRNGNRIYKGEAIKALYDMINFCKELRATPILITTPYLKEYNEVVKNNDPEFYSDFYTIIDEIVRNTGVKYYDYSFDERYTNNYRYFFNTDYLNREGARVFTNNLMREILSIDVIAP